jgi:hypothetical protein
MKHSWKATFNSKIIYLKNCFYTRKIKQAERNKREWLTKERKDEHKIYTSIYNMNNIVYVWWNSYLYKITMPWDLIQHFLKFDTVNLAFFLLVCSKTSHHVWEHKMWSYLFIFWVFIILKVFLVWHVEAINLKSHSI